MVSDGYSWRARLAPAVLAAAPALSLVGVAVFRAPEEGSIAALVVGALCIAICAFVRDRGGRLEPDLWHSWGGAPTTRRLRWRGSSRADTSELHRRIEEVLGIALPNAHQEASDPDSADGQYERVTARLREKTRDRTAYPLVFEENVDYGFRRNCLAIRRIALCIAVVCVLLAAGIAVAGEDVGAGPDRRYLSTVGIGVVAGGFWWRTVTQAWVRTAGERYADRLFDALTTIAG